MGKSDKLLAHYYLENNITDIPRMLDINFRDLDHHKEYTKWCGAGEGSISFIDVAGSVYPCQMFAPISAGNLSKMKDMIQLDAEYLQDEACKNCILVAICPTCYGANYIDSGNPAKRSKDTCKIMRVRTLVSAYYKSKKILQSLDIENSKSSEINSIYAQLRGIKKVLATSETWNDLGICAP